MFIIVQSKEQPPFHLNFCYNPALDFMCSLISVAKEASLSELMNDFQYTSATRARMKQQNEEMRSRLSPFLVQELDYFVGGNMAAPHFEIPIQKLFIDRPDLDTVEQLIALTQGLTATELLIGMTEAVFANNMNELLETTAGWEALQQDQSALLERINQTAAETPLHKQQLLDCFREPIETKQRYLYLISQFYQRAFAPMAEQLADLGTAGAFKYQQLLKERPDKDTFEQLLKMDPSEFKKPVYIHVSAVMGVGLLYCDTAEGEPFDWILMGVDNDEILLQHNDREIVEKFLKAVADKRRLDILMLIRNRLWYGNELALELGLTPANVSYHINFLFGLDLISLTRADGRIYYTINEDRFRTLLELTAQTLLGPQQHKRSDPNDSDL